MTFEKVLMERPVLRMKGYDKASTVYDMVRTRQGIKLMKLVGECIKEGGAVDMDFVTEDWHVYASGKLRWAA